MEETPPLGRACLNCGEEHDAGYTTGEVGPFCSACWEKLEARFSKPAVEAEPPTCATCQYWRSNVNVDGKPQGNGSCRNGVMQASAYTHMSFGCTLHTPTPPTEDR